MPNQVKKVIVVDSDYADPARVYDERVALFNQNASELNSIP